MLIAQRRDSAAPQSADVTADAALFSPQLQSATLHHQHQLQLHQHQQHQQHQHQQHQHQHQQQQLLQQSSHQQHVDSTLLDNFVTMQIHGQDAMVQDLPAAAAAAASDASMRHLHHASDRADLAMLVHSHSRVSRQHAYGRRDSFGPADSQSSLLDDADFQDDDDDDEEDVRKCEWGDCSLEFDSKQELVAHVNDHIGSGRASYICEWRGCSRLLRPFTKRHKVQNHVRTHTKERPFVCTIEDCGKSFSRLDGLNTHIRTHSNIKPFVCSVPGCGKAYFHARSLRKHERSHTGADAEHLEMAAAAAAMVIPSSSLLDDDLTGGSDTSAPDSIIHVRQSHPQQQKQQQHLADPHMSFDLSYVPNGAGLRHGTAPNGDDASVSAAMAASGMFDAAMSPSSMYPGLLDHHHQHQQQQQQQAHFAQQHHDAHNLKMQQSMLASYDYAQASYRQQLAAAAAQHLPQQSLLIMPEPNGPLSLDMPVATAVDPRYTAWAAPSADI